MSVTQAFVHITGVHIFGRFMVGLRKERRAIHDFISRADVFRTLHVPDTACLMPTVFALFRTSHMCPYVPDTCVPIVSLMHVGTLAFRCITLSAGFHVRWAAARSASLAHLRTQTTCTPIACKLRQHPLVPLAHA